MLQAPLISRDPFLAGFAALRKQFRRNLAHPALSGEAALAPGTMARLDRHMNSPRTGPAPAAFPDSAKGHPANTSSRGTAEIVSRCRDWTQTQRNETSLDSIIDPG